MRIGGGASRAEVKATIGGNTAIAVDLYRQLRNSQGNLFFSPYSISSELALVYAGARGNTEKEMAAVLHCSLVQDRLHPALGALQARLNRMQQAGHVKLCMANSLWPCQDAKILSDYLSLTQRHYGVSVTPIDYANAQGAANTINRWVEQRTEDTIRNLMAPGMFNDLTRLALVNAIYFKGVWVYQFNPRLTQDRPFYVTPENPVETPMMAGTVKVRYAEAEGLQVLELPYMGNDLAMMIFLPKARDGLRQMEDVLSVDQLSSWKQGLKKREVLTYLPRFTMTCHYRLEETLQAMGMVDAFKLSQADLSGMSETPLCLDVVVHQAFVEVNEEGTEAAATTGLAFPAARDDPPPRPPTFLADHPFLFLIQSEDGTILFLGRLTDPTKG